MRRATRRTDFGWPVVPDGLRELLVALRDALRRRAAADLHHRERLLLRRRVRTPTAWSTTRRGSTTSTRHLRAVADAIADGRRRARLLHLVAAGQLRVGRGLHPALRPGARRLRDPACAPRRRSYDWYRDLIAAQPATDQRDRPPAGARPLRASRPLGRPGCWVAWLTLAARAVGGLLRADPGAARPAGRGGLARTTRSTVLRRGHRRRRGGLGGRQPAVRRAVGPHHVAVRAPGAVGGRRRAARRARAGAARDRRQSVLAMVLGLGLAQASLNAMFAALTATVPDLVPGPRARRGRRLGRGVADPRASSPGSASRPPPAASRPATTRRPPRWSCSRCRTCSAAATSRCRGRCGRPFSLAGVRCARSGSRRAGTRTSRWAWLTRFLVNLGNSLGTLLLYFYLQDAVELPRPRGRRAACSPSSTRSSSSPARVVVRAVVGPARRRKVFVIVSGLVTGLRRADPRARADLARRARRRGGVRRSATASTSRSTSRCSPRCCPPRDARAKDLGVINIAVALPQVFAPFVGLVPGRVRRRLRDPLRRRLRGLPARQRLRAQHPRSAVAALPAGRPQPHLEELASVTDSPSRAPRPTWSDGGVGATGTVRHRPNRCGDTTST